MRCCPCPTTTRSAYSTSVIRTSGRQAGRLAPMAEKTDWTFPEELQPKAESLSFDLDALLRTVVLLRAEVPDDAFTAAILDTERVGSGIVIRPDGLVLTIGYLITEA